MKTPLLLPQNLIHTDASREAARLLYRLGLRYDLLNADSATLNIAALHAIVDRVEALEARRRN